MVQLPVIKLANGSATALPPARSTSSTAPQASSTRSGVLDNVLALLSVALILATAVFVIHACIGA